MDVQNPPESDFVERCHWQLYHRQIRISVEFVRDKLVVELFDFGGQGLRKETGVDLFSDVGGAVAEEAAHDGHGQAVVDGENREGVAGCVKRQWEWEPESFSDNVK